MVLDDGCRACRSAVSSDRVGSPLSLASIARDLPLSPATVATYLEILQALFIVFTIRPWHKNIARGLLKTPKVYFYDTGLVTDAATWLAELSA